MRKASEIVTALFRDRFGPGFMDTARSTAGLFSSWGRIVAEIWPQALNEERNDDDTPAASVHSRIRELERGMLFIEADHPGWIQILQTKQKELLASVQRRYPGLNIGGIAFRLSRETFASPVDGEGIHPENSTKVKDLTRRESAPGEEWEPPLPGPAPVRPRKPGDEEFYAALKSLEESVKKRNSTP